MFGIERQVMPPLGETAAILDNLLMGEMVHDEPMSRHTTLKVGGPAQLFWAAQNVDQLSNVLTLCVQNSIPYLFVGHGSNLLMSDLGYPGLVIKNRCKSTSIGPNTTAESGVSFGSLFYQTARAGFSGLEWAIGIPGTVGGALVSNAGAYRGNIGPLVQRIRVFSDGEDTIVGPQWMEFSYRDSKLRRNGIGRDVILSCELALEAGDPDEIMVVAKEYQEQRRRKQPFLPSAGSFFKNVINHELAAEMHGLSAGMKSAGVVPAGFLIEGAGLKGLRIGGAEVSDKHANFLTNAHLAKASDIRQLAAVVKIRVKEHYGVELEEEVLYVGDWSNYPVAESQQL